jgi:hypothetical protein
LIASIQDGQDGVFDALLKTRVRCEAREAARLVARSVATALSAHGLELSSPLPVAVGTGQAALYENWR